MDQSQRDLGTLRKSEVIGGLLYLPAFFLVTPILAALVVFFVTGTHVQAELAGPIELVYTAMNAVFLGLLFRHYLLDQWRRLQNRGWAIFADLGFGFLIYFAGAMAISRVMGILQMLLQTEYQNANQEAAEAILAQWPLAAILAACLLAPIGEELLFRGLVFCGLRRKSRTLAYAASMLSFSLAHVLGSMFDQPLSVTLMALIVYLPHSFALAWTYEHSGSIWGSVFLHATLNSFSMLVLAAMR